MANNRISFGRKAIKVLLVQALFMFIAEFTFASSAAVIAGQFLGDDSLSAINLMMPIFNYVCFIAEVIDVGGNILYNRSVGEYNEEHSNEIFGMCMILAISLGLMTLAVLTVGRDYYINSLGLSDSIRNELLAYWKYEKYVLAMMPINYYLSGLLYTDTRLNTIANVVMFVSGIGTSIVLTIIYGISGTALGYLLGYVLSTLILSAHFLKKKNIIHFRWYFSFRDVIEMLKLSLVDASKFLDCGLLMTFINAYVLKNYTDELLPVTSILLLVIEFIAVFDFVGTALMPVAEVYLGEGNNEDEKDVAQYSLRVALVSGIIVTIFLLVFAPYLPAVFGVTEAASVARTISALRIIAFAMPFGSVALALISQYISVRKIAFSVVYEWSKSFILPLLLILFTGKIVGYNGIWLGFVLAELLTVISFALVIKKIYGKNTSLLLVEDNNRPTFSRSYYVSEQTATDARDDIESFLLEENVERSIINKVMITVEEMTLFLLSKNNDAKVIVQYTAYIEDGKVYVYERDNGKAYNLIDTDADLINFNQYILNCLIGTSTYNRYLVTIDYNRCLLSF